MIENFKCISLLNGPDGRGPVGQLLELLREHGAVKQHALAMSHSSDKPRKAIALGTVHTVGHREAIVL
jgi:hypothetical protein